MTYKLKVNGIVHEVDVPADTPLLWALRDGLGIKGPKFGCGMGLCGCCTVHLDNAPIRSCSMAVADVSGEITTIEGVAGPEADALRAAWIDLDVPQCGYCQAGQLMSAIALLRDSRQPDEAAIDAGMAGNICRCGTYDRIRAAIRSASGTLSGKG
ncbi:(2Fe-2S)-binding protein [Sphingobium sp. H39-3-25]|uniref:(2Fe-2S)-binding protein n=1 Tax=Sphingobium arseniciresistens TaxID=3030834 RepID=UPI0023B991E2|nr:(2Fe-2S)-binding protein [Sphingobium arseniciresistens]